MSWIKLPIKLELVDPITGKKEFKDSTLRLDLSTLVNFYDTSDEGFEGVSCTRISLSNGDSMVVYVKAETIEALICKGETKLYFPMPPSQS